MALDEPGSRRGRTTIATLESIRNVVEAFPKELRDPGNSYDTAPAADETRVGDWVDLQNKGHFILLYFQDTPAASVSLQFSEDGITPVSDPLLGTIPLTAKFDGVFHTYLSNLGIPLYRYVRVVYTNGPTPPTLFGQHFWVTSENYGGTYGALDDPLGAISLALLTRSVQAGVKLDGLLQPTSSFENVSLTQDNALRTAMPGSTLFQYRTPDDPPLPSGAPVVIDRVLNTEPNVLDSGWIPSAAYPGGQELLIIADQAGVDVFLLNASDDQGSNWTGNLFPSLTTVDPGVPGVTAAPMFGRRYFRMVVVNRSGSTLNEIVVNSAGNQLPTPPVYTSIEQPKFTFFPAALNQSALLGRVPGTNQLKLIEITTSGFLNTSAADFLREVSLGRVANHEAITIFARNPAVGSTFEDVWSVGGTYVYPSVADTVTLTGTSLLDDDGNTGAREVTIRGLDASYNEVEEALALDGLTPVVSTTQFLRVREVVVTRAGTLGENQGTITALHAGSLTVGRIEPGVNTTVLGHYTVPAGKTALLVFEQPAVGQNDQVEIQFMHRGTAAEEPFTVDQTQILAGGNLTNHVFVSEPFPEKTDIKWRAKKVNAGTADLSVEYRLLLIDNEAL